VQPLAVPPAVLCRHRNPPLKRRSTAGRQGFTAGAMPSSAASTRPSRPFNYQQLWLPSCGVTDGVVDYAFFSVNVGNGCTNTAGYGCILSYNVSNPAAVAISGTGLNVPASGTNGCRQVPHRFTF
jgi:hypothetical protein